MNDSSPHRTLDRQDTGGGGSGGTGKVGLGPKKEETTSLPVPAPFELTVQVDPQTGVLNLTYRSDPGGGGSGQPGKVGLGPKK